MLGFMILSRAWLSKALCILYYFYMFATIAMTLFLILFMFLVIMFIFYFDYIPIIARIIIMFMHMFAKLSLYACAG